MSNTHSSNPHHEPTGVTEPDHVDIKAVVNFGIGLTVVTVAAHLAMLLMFNVLAKQSDAAEPPRLYPLAALPTEPRVPGDPSGTQPPEPRLQTDPKKDLADLRKGEDEILNGYGWVDHNNNVVRIPIADAMKLTLQRGLPARDPAAAQSAPAEAAPPATAPATQEPPKEPGQ